MDPNLYKFILGLAGVVIMLLLTIIGYFLKRQVEATESLESTVKILNLSVELLKNNQDNREATWRSKNREIEKKLQDHSEKLEEHGQEILELKLTSSPKPRVKKQLNHHEP